MPCTLYRTEWKFSSSGSSGSTRHFGVFCMYIAIQFFLQQLFVLVKPTVEKSAKRAFERCIDRPMSFHPSGETVEIFGINSDTNGRSCEEHPICGSVLQDDVVVRFRKVQVSINNKEESAIAAFWVSDGVDRCRVGYLPRHHVKHWKMLEGVLGQIVEVYDKDSDSPTKRQKHYRNSGCAIAAIISPPLLFQPELPSKKLPSKKRKTQEEDNNNMEHDENHSEKEQQT